MVFGSNAEIAGPLASDKAAMTTGPAPSRTVNEVTAASLPDVAANGDDDGQHFWTAAEHLIPDLPHKLTPSQADSHLRGPRFPASGSRRRSGKSEPTEEGAEITVPLHDWQKVQAVQLLLARYLRAVAEPSPPNGVQ